jgi:hypothetical protein
MTRVPFRCCTLLLASVLPAQIFSASAVTATPMTVTCSVPGLPPRVDTVPAGVPAGSVWLAPVLGGPNGSASAYIDPVYQTFPNGVHLMVDERASSFAQGVTTIAPHDYLFRLQATVPTPVQLAIQWSGSRSTNQPLPLVQVDIGDDGIFDFVAVASGQILTVPLVVGPGSFDVRTRTALTVADGYSNSNLHCAVTPNFPVLSSVQGQACGLALTASTTLQHELVLATQALPLTVFAIGSTTVFVPLPLTSNCLLGPTPEIVLAAVQGRLVIDLQTLPRPVSFFVQGVSLLPATNAVLATETERITVQ